MEFFGGNNLKLSLKFLFSISEYQTFYSEYSSKYSIKCKDDFYILIDKFREYLSSRREITEDENILLKHVIECSENEFYKNNEESIFFINKIKAPNEYFLEEFNKEFSDTVTDELFFEEINKGKYKTVTENIALYGVDGKKLSELYIKYKDFNHPYIYDNISEPIIQAKNFSNGIPILKKSLKYAFRYPNPFWHSIAGIDACASSLYRIQFLLGRDGLVEMSKNIECFESKILKLIFLYLSRVIYMSEANIISIDAYSNRARIVRDYNYQFMNIFGIGVNPDIQYISDKYLAYTTAIKHNLVGPPYIQFMWDSMKMYQHGSHIPNSFGGYKEIEDATWMQLVQRGHIRSINLSKIILSEFENYQLNLTNSEIDFISDYTINKNVDDFENYIDEIKK